MGQYLVWCHDQTDDPEDGVTIEASDPVAAAELWAEQDDRESAEYWIVGGNEADVTVKDTNDGTETRFIVTGEDIPSYSAKKSQREVE